MKGWRRPGAAVRLREYRVFHLFQISFLKVRGLASMSLSSEGTVDVNLLDGGESPEV